MRVHKVTRSDFGLPEATPSEKGLAPLPEPQTDVMPVVAIRPVAVSRNCLRLAICLEKLLGLLMSASGQQQSFSVILAQRPLAEVKQTLRAQGGSGYSITYRHSSCLLCL